MSHQDEGRVREPLLAFSIALASLAASGAEADTPYSYFTSAWELDGDLIFSSDSAVVFLPNHSPEADHVSTVKLRTDECGLPASITNNHAMLRRTSVARTAPDALQDEDDFDPLVDALTQISRWFSTHPEIAVISDGLDKWCDDGSFLDEDIPPELIASWRAQSLPGSSHQSPWSRRQDSVYIV